MRRSKSVGRGSNNDQSVNPSSDNTYKLIEAVAPTDRVRRAYDLWSTIYANVAGLLEHGPRLRGLELAGICRQDAVLEVAVGTGAILLEILKKVDRDNTVYGIDLSPRMLEGTRQYLHGAGYSNVRLVRADSRHLPFLDKTFDLIYSSYLLDLLEFKDILLTLGEFKRVLRPGGRVVLVNLSKENPFRLTWLERFYTWLPKACVPYILGSCRPILIEDFVKTVGFTNTSREFIKRLTHSEILTARKPAFEQGS